MITNFGSFDLFDKVRFDQPAMLLLLSLIPVAVVLYAVALRNKRRRAMTFSAVDVLGDIARPTRFRRHVPFLSVLVSAALMIAVSADPQVQGSVTSQQRTVMVVVDISKSMSATDVAPTRLEAAVEAATRFIDRIPDGYQIGLVVFSGVARVKATPTTNRERVRKGLAELSVENGTATGDALILALSQFGENTSGGVVVLLSDGRQTAGSVPMESAAGALKAAGVKVYAIALGTASGKISVMDSPNGPARVETVPPDPVGLGVVTSVTGGKTFEAVTIEQLNEIYDSVGGHLHVMVGWVSAAWFFALAALLALLVAGFTARRYSVLP